MIPTGNTFVDVLVYVIIAAATSNLAVEVFRALSGTLRGRAQRKRDERKQEALAAEVQKRLATHWEGIAFENRRIALIHGAPLKEFPDMGEPNFNPPPPDQPDD